MENNNLKQKLIERFGLSEAKEIEALDNNKLFIKSGITVIASLAGTGRLQKCCN